MSAMFSKPKMPAMPAPPDEDSAAKAQAALDMKKRAANAKGRGYSILGGSMDQTRSSGKRLLGE